MSTFKINITEAGHPIPDEAGLQGTRRIIEILEQTTEKDLVIAVISGGGSALLELPVEGISLDDLQTLTQKLLRAGTTINQINTVRKHLSRLKGGNLAKLAYPSTLVNLILSDVVGSPLDVIASGPAVPDATTYRDAWNVLQQYRLTEPGDLPESIIQHLQKGIAGDVAETPKPGDMVFDKVQTVIIGDNRVAAEAAARKALDLGYQPLILTTFLEGEAREVAKVLVAIAREVATCDIPVKKPACIIAGGETTVTIRGEGKGGRNQELALAAALALDGLHNILCAPMATDGTDGPTDAAGAVVDGFTVSRAREKELDPVKYLENNDAYNFFLNEGNLLVTGPTNTNVNDITLLLVW